MYMLSFSEVHFIFDSQHHAGVEALKSYILASFGLNPWLFCLAPFLLHGSHTFSVHTFSDGFPSEDQAKLFIYTALTTGNLFFFFFPPLIIISSRDKNQLTDFDVELSSIEQPSAAPSL